MLFPFVETVRRFLGNQKPKNQRYLMRSPSPAVSSFIPSCSFLLPACTQRQSTTHNPRHSTLRSVLLRTRAYSTQAREHNRPQKGNFRRLFFSETRRTQTTNEHSGFGKDLIEMRYFRRQTGSFSVCALPVTPLSYREHQLKISIDGVC